MNASLLILLWACGSVVSLAGAVTLLPENARLNEMKLGDVVATVILVPILGVLCIGVLVLKAASFIDWKMSMVVWRRKP